MDWWFQLMEAPNLSLTFPVSRIFYDVGNRDEQIVQHSLTSYVYAAATASHGFRFPTSPKTSSSLSHRTSNVISPHRSLGRKICSPSKSITRPTFGAQRNGPFARGDLSSSSMQLSGVLWASKDSNWSMAFFATMTIASRSALRTSFLGIEPPFHSYVSLRSGFMGSIHSEGAPNCWLTAEVLLFATIKFAVETFDVLLIAFAVVGSHSRLVYDILPMRSLYIFRITWASQ